MDAYYPLNIGIISWQPWTLEKHWQRGGTTRKHNDSDTDGGVRHSLNIWQRVDPWKYAKNPVYRCHVREGIANKPTTANKKLNFSMLKEISGKCFVYFFVGNQFWRVNASLHLKCLGVTSSWQSKGLRVTMPTPRKCGLIDALFRDHDKRDDMPQDTLILFDLPIYSYNSGYVL